MGADRALKRLRVTPIEEECLEHPPTVSPDASLADARAAIAKWDAGWVAVVGPDGVLRGYVDDEHAGGDGAVAERLQRIETWVPLDHDLQDALATMLLTHEGWVSVLDGDRFVGVLTPEAVYQTLRRSLEQRRTTTGNVGAMEMQRRRGRRPGRRSGIDRSDGDAARRGRRPDAAANDRSMEMQRRRGRRPGRRSGIDRLS